MTTSKWIVLGVIGTLILLGTLTILFPNGVGMFTWWTHVTYWLTPPVVILAITTIILGATGFLLHSRNATFGLILFGGGALSFVAVVAMLLFKANSRWGWGYLPQFPWLNATAVTFFILALALGATGFYAHRKGMLKIGPAMIIGGTASFVLAFALLLGIDRWLYTAFTSVGASQGTTAFDPRVVMLITLAIVFWIFGFLIRSKKMVIVGIVSLIGAFVVLLGFWDKFYFAIRFVITRWARTGFATDQDLLTILGGLLILAILLFIPEFRKKIGWALGALAIVAIPLVALTYWLGTDHVMRGGTNLGAAFERATLQAGVVTSSGNWVDYTAPPKGSTPAVVPVGFGYTCLDGNEGKTYLLFKKGKGTKDFRYEIVSLTRSPATASILISTSKAERDHACPHLS